LAPRPGVIDDYVMGYTLRRVAMQRLLEHDWDWLGEDRFESGLAALLDGIAARYGG
jgi:hypothetical protein